MNSVCESGIKQRYLIHFGTTKTLLRKNEYTIMMVVLIFCIYFTPI